MIPSNCKRCGYCCTLTVILSKIEYFKLFFLGHKKFATKDIKGRICIRQKSNNNCFFYKKNRCSIYKHRPKMCREYPGIKICRQDEN